MHGTLGHIRHHVGVIYQSRTLEHITESRSYYHTVSIFLFSLLTG